MSDYIVRNATPQDIEPITELWKEFMDFHAQRDPNFIRSKDGHQKFAEWVNSNIVEERSCVMVAEQDGKVVGYCLSTIAQNPPVFVRKEFGEIYDMAVATHCRRSGVGQALLEAVVQWFREQGIDRIELQYATTNEISTAFWTKMDFKPYMIRAFQEV